jgi:hypothetical protein
VTLLKAKNAPRVNIHEQFMAQIPLINPPSKDHWDELFSAIQQAINFGGNLHWQMTSQMLSPFLRKEQEAFD